MMVPPARQSVAPEAAHDPLAVWVPQDEHARRELDPQETSLLDAIAKRIALAGCGNFGVLSQTIITARYCLPTDEAQSGVLQWLEVSKALLALVAETPLEDAKEMAEFAALAKRAVSCACQVFDWVDFASDGGAQ